MGVITPKKSRNPLFLRALGTSPQWISGFLAGERIALDPKSGGLLNAAAAAAEET